jgi:hypothetical protein
VSRDPPTVVGRHAAEADKKFGHPGHATPDLGDALRVLVDAVGDVLAPTAPLDDYIKAASYDPGPACIRAHNERLRRDAWSQFIEHLTAKAPGAEPAAGHRHPADADGTRRLPSPRRRVRTDAAAMTRLVPPRRLRHALHGRVRQNAGPRLTIVSSEAAWDTVRGALIGWAVTLGAVRLAEECGFAGEARG